MAGDLAVGVTIQASYESGNYVAPNDSDAGGTFTWTLTDDTGASKTHSGSTYEVKAEDPGRQVTVTYTPPAESKFTGSVEKQAGEVVKASVTAPAVPAVQAVADTGRGSTIKITNADIGSWYKILPASEPKPGLVMDQNGVAAGWSRAGATVLNITGLTANTDYIVYGAKLETEITAASILTASAMIRTGKEELGSAIAVSEPLKLMADTRVTVSTYDQAPDGTWYWYASKERTADFKLIRSNRGVKESTVTADTFQIPYDYSGYYIKVIFQADGDFTGEKT